MVPLAPAPVQPVATGVLVHLVQPVPQVRGLVKGPSSKLKLLTKIGLANPGTAASARVASTRMVLDFIVLVNIRGPPLPSVAPQPHRSSLTSEFLRRSLKPANFSLLPAKCYLELQDHYSRPGTFR